VILTKKHKATIDAESKMGNGFGASGTPTFFINGRRHHGAYDMKTLSDAVRLAQARVDAARARERSASRAQRRIA
jgi:protein-disulfide isomerase